MLKFQKFARRFFLCAGLLILRASFLFSQASSFSFTTLDHTSGLSSVMNTSITRDSSGFTWIGGTNGLQRYDGYNFVTFRLDPSRKTSLPSNIVEQVAVDKKNRVWILTNTGVIARLEKEKDFKVIQSAMSNSRNMVFSFDKHHEMYITLYHGVLHYDSDKQKVDTLLWLPAAADFSITTPIVFDEVNKVAWLGTNHGLYYFDSGMHKIISCHSSGSRFDIPTQRFITSLLLDSVGKLWISGYAPVPLYIYQFANKKLWSYSDVYFRKRFNHRSLRPVDINGMIEDGFHRVWLATTGCGLLMHDSIANDFIQYRNDVQNPLSLKYTKDIYSITMLQDGNIWLCTDMGISYFSPGKGLFTNYFHEPGKNSIPVAEVTGFLHARNGAICMTTYEGGLVQCDNKFQVRKVYSSFGGTSNFPESLENRFWAVEEDGKGNIWVGGQYGAVAVFDPLSGKFNNLPPTQFYKQTIKVIKKDLEGNVWLASSGSSLVKHDGHQDKFIFFDSLLRKKKLANAIINDLLFDGPHTIWIASDLHGLILMDQKGAFVKQFIPADPQIDLVADSTVLCLNRYDDHTLLVGTMSNGLYLFNTVSLSFHRLKPLNGEFDSYITGISSPVNGVVWIASVNGLSAYDLQSKKLMKYSGSDGILNDNFSSKIFSMGRELLVGNTTGFMVIHPYYKVASETGNKVTITGIRILNREMAVSPLPPDSPPLELSYKENFLTFYFVSPDYAKIHSQVYYYMLEGLDPDWKMVTDYPQANYTNIQEGKYVFKVYAENRAGEQGPVTFFQIIITPPFWHRTWFYIIAFLLGVTVLILIYLLRIRSVRKEEKRLKENELLVQEMKLNVLRTQLNPHFMFNSLNAIQHFILCHEEHQAAEYLSKFASLMRQVLENSLQVLIPLSDEINILKLYLELENLRFGNSLLIQWKLDPALQLVETMVPPLLAQPCIENAIWHGLQHKLNGDKKLFISFFKEKENLCITVEDNGIGRKKAEEIKRSRPAIHDSKGMFLVEERIKLLGNHQQSSSRMEVTDLENPPGTAAGTRLKIIIPIIKNVV